MITVTKVYKHQKKKIQHKDSVSDAKDSTVIKAVPEEDPPVKHGGHWKIKNN